MKRSFFAYIILALSVVSCMNAETAPSGDDLLAPELQISQPTGSTQNFKVLFQAKQSSKTLSGDCGFYLSSSSDFSNSEKVRADNVSKSDRTFSLTRELHDYGTKYYCKAYSSNGHVEICSSVGSYTVKDFASYVSAGKPEAISTLATKTILKYSISAAEGITLTDCGLCYGKTREELSVESAHISGGTSAGEHTATIDGLTLGQSYYACSYVREKDNIAYGEAVSFVACDVPVVSTVAPSDVEGTSAVCGGNGIDPKGSDITDKGVVWSTEHNPELSSSTHVSAGSGSDSFTCTISDLSPVTTYYVRAYVKNTAGVGYGEEQSFTTKSIPVTGVSLSQSSISIAKNFSYTLTASVLPENAIDKSVSWESSNTAVATVSSGVVTGVAAGSATVTVRTVDGNKTASCSVKVIESQGLDLSVNGTANCYIVNKAGRYMFNATVKGGSTESVGSPSSAETLWESFGTDVTPNVGDIVSNVSYSDGYICFSTPSSLNNGNAVIAVKDATGIILWSWHIWVCDGFDADATAQVYNNGAGTMMDRNLGATSATPGDVHALGLLYQWGRKDPFLSGCQISYSSYSSQQAASTLSWPSAVSSNSSNGTIAYAVAHPTTFISQNYSNSDWYYTGSSSTDNTRWQTSDKTKGIYDPCPKGWRVPDGGSRGVWSKAFGSSSSYSCGPWDSTNNGMNFGSGNGQSSSHQLGSARTIWYPAAGCRDDAHDGSLYSVGSNGDYWSCTPNDHYAQFLSLCNSSVAPMYRYYRAYGRSVRCLSE